ncbi:CcdB family protein [Luteimonas abyssi]|uniref:CcdB family protein n=1 Tax=Luteimonas abyssi TaxID=1247514 RepID=UPI000737BB6F|nr:CcdB family protein [Luteimonas abyssi]
MAQFDVHRNPGRTRHAIPYVVVVQSAVFDDSRSRVVVPLVRAADVRVASERFNPTFVVMGDAVVLHPLETTAVAIQSFGEPVASLSDHGDDILAAMDELLTRAYG